MPGIHHPKNPPDPAMLAPHPRETCDRDRCGYGPWRPAGVNPADVLAVATAYAGRDSWGVENIYLRTLSRLLADLAAGIPAALIAAHASHVGSDCCALGRAE